MPGVFEKLPHVSVKLWNESSNVPPHTPHDRRGPPSLPRAEPGLHGLNRWTVKC